MIFEFVGHDGSDAPCTTTTLDVTPISAEEYGDPAIQAELEFFENGGVQFFCLNQDTIGFARNHGGQSGERGHYVHNRLFAASENPVDHLQLTNTANTAENLSLAKLPTGSRIAIGYIAGGKGMQVRVSRLDVGRVEYHVT